MEGRCWSQSWRLQKERAYSSKEWEAGAALGLPRHRPPCGAAEGGPASLTRPLSPEQPAVHDLTFQAGGVCLQPIPKQREPQPGGSCHPHHHEPESYRSVVSGNMCHVTRGRKSWSCALTTVCGAHGPGIPNWPVFSLMPSVRPLSSASSLHLFMNLKGPVSLSLPYSWGN